MSSAFQCTYDLNITVLSMQINTVKKHPALKIQQYMYMYLHEGYRLHKHSNNCLHVHYDGVKKRVLPQYDEDDDADDSDKSNDTDYCTNNGTSTD
jgi:hypothetical protein